MHPTIDLDFTEISVYTALVMLGAAAGIAAAYIFLRAHSRRLSAWPLFLDGTLFVFVFSWIGARAYHVVTHWEYYAARPEDIVSFGALPDSPLQAGLAMRGALIAGLLALALYAAIRRVSFWRLADAAALGLALGQAIGWVAALVQGSNYGVVSDQVFAVDMPDLYGLVQPRFPLQQVEIALFALLFVGLVAAALKQPRAGTLFLTFIMLSSLASFVLGFQRGDDTLYIGALRSDQIVDGALAAGTLLVWLGWLWSQRAPTRRVGNVGNIINV